MSTGINKVHLGELFFVQNEQFADAFRIEYRRDKEQKWIKYKDFSGQYVRIDYLV